MFPEMMELRKIKSGDPQLIILGAELSGNKVQAQGFISLEPIRKGRRFWFDRWRFEVKEALPDKTVAIYPSTMTRTFELEIIQWPHMTKS